METVRNELVRSIGQAAKVRTLEDMSPIEIRDLDGETMREEILSAESTPDGHIKARIASLKQAFESSQTALVVLPTRWPNVCVW